MSDTTFLEIEQYRPRPPLFSMRGRIGRARWVLYGIAAICGAFLVMVLAGYALHLSGSLGRMLYQILFTLLYFCALPIFFMQLTVRRAHDFNVEGWLALLLLVPLLNLIFCFIPGTRGENTYGPELEPESTVTKVTAVVVPLLFIGAFLAARTEMPQQTDQQSNAQPAVVQPAKPLRPYTP
jgi:uncharacterized membrane protein YhaH (DUF805 family)